MDADELIDIMKDMSIHEKVRYANSPSNSPIPF